MEFDAWMSDKANDHGYWVVFEPKSYFDERNVSDPFAMGRDLSGKDGLCYGEDAFVDWLNRFVLQGEGEKARIVSLHNIVERTEKGRARYPAEWRYPHLFF